MPRVIWLEGTFFKNHFQVQILVAEKYDQYKDFQASNLLCRIKISGDRNISSKINRTEVKFPAVSKIFFKECISSFSHSYEEVPEMGNF